jgi:hypothetical protein
LFEAVAYLLRPDDPAAWPQHGHHLWRAAAGDLAEHRLQYGALLEDVAGSHLGRALRDEEDAVDTAVRRIADPGADVGTGLQRAVPFG